MATLVFNGGSSSWKCGVYDVAADARAIDATDPVVDVSLSGNEAKGDGVVGRILDALAQKGVDLATVPTVGHRIVHGGSLFTETTWLDDANVAKLATLAPFAPSHNPMELAAVRAVRERMPHAAQYGVFDTQFHRTLAPVAYTYPGPYDWLSRGIRRYGFHGSSVAYATERATSMLGRATDDVNIIVAHLGSGCSVTAVRDGRSVDTSMGFTPLDGTMMSTRSGAVDPAIAVFLAREAASDGTTLAAFADDLDHTLNAASGLLGISGVSGDLREVRAAAAGGNERANAAIELFAHRTCATIASLLPHFTRLDALVFTGGIGEHDVALRDAVRARLGFVAIPHVFVVTSREDWYIAREGSRLLRG